MSYARRKGGTGHYTRPARNTDFGLLGPLEVRVGGRPVEVGSPKLRVLLAALLLQHGQVVPVGELAEAVWGEAQPSNPRRAVQLYVTRLRSLLACPGVGELISTHADGYRLETRPEQVDLGRFRMGLERAGRAAQAASADSEADALADALALWRGTPLAGIPSEVLQREVVPRLTEQRLQVMERRFDVELRLGRHARLVDELLALTAQYPLHERLWAQLMTVLDRCGRRAEALSAYQSIRRQLADELGIDPGEELRSVHAEILVGRSAPANPRATRDDPDAFAGHGLGTEMRGVSSWSYLALTDASARLFRLLVLHPGPDIATAAVASLAGIPVPRTRRLLIELCDARLITENTPGRFGLDDLPRAYAAELALTHDSAASRRQAQHRLLDHYLLTAHAAALALHPAQDRRAPASAAPGVTAEEFTDHRQALHWLEVEQAALVALVDHAAAEFPAHTWQLAWTITDHLLGRGQWHDATTALRAALDTATRVGDRTEQAHAHRGLAWAYTRLGRLTAADEHGRLALGLAEDADDHIGTAHAHRALGLVRETQGRHRDALHHDRRALDIFAASGYRCGQARALNAVGWDHALLGDARQAIGYCERGLALLAELGDRLGQAAAWDTLGYAHHCAGDHRRALAAYQRALDLSRDVGHRYNEAGVLAHIGDSRHAMGDLEGARTAWRQALDIFVSLGHHAAGTIRGKLHRLEPSRR